MQMNLEGAVALVTGANGEIGKAVCASLARDGAAVIASDLATEAGDGPALVLDVTDEQSWRDAMATIRARHGRLDILINNAGVAPVGRLEDMTLEEWRFTQAVNVDGAFLGTKAAAPLLRESGKARTGGAAIVNIASGAADRPAAFSGAYCTSKAALAMLTRTTAIEFAALQYPIRVNSVHPGALRSPMMNDILERYAAITGKSLSELSAMVLERHPMGRYVEADEVADAVAFLVSSAARYIHGEALHVDGGHAAA
jgi:NAD(P)-dependent dehydrogenase (short-subunit alcohol dehydrogenase family)